MNSNDAAVEISFADVARGMLTSPLSSHQSMLVNKPASVDIAIQVSPMDFHQNDDSARADVGVQAGEDELVINSSTGRCCPYCHSQLPAGDVTSANESEANPLAASSVPTVDNGMRAVSSVATVDNGMHAVSSVPTVDNGMRAVSSVPAVDSVMRAVSSVSTVDNGMHAVSSVPTVDNGMRLLSSVSESVAASSSTPTVSSPVTLPVQCSLSLGDSFHYSPLRNCLSTATASSNTFTSSHHGAAGSPVSAAVAPVYYLPMSSSLNDNGLGSADVDDGSVMHADGLTSLPVAHSQSASESSLISTPVVTFSVTPEAARLPASADSGGQLSNTSLSNITLSDLLPSMQGSIPLELLVNQTDGFAMYTEIIPVSESCHVDPLPSMDLPASESGCVVAEVLDAVESHESWSPAQLESHQSPVNMMVCLPISSVSSPSLSSFLSQHKSLSSFAGEAALSRPPSPEALAPGSTMETVAIAMVPSVEDRVPKSTVNYSIHRIVEASALKQAGPVADCSWSSSNTGVLISRRDIPTNSAALSDSSIGDEDDTGRPPDSSCHGDSSCHVVDRGYQGDHIFRGNDSRRGDDSDTHDDICVIDSDRDIIVIDGDDDVLRPRGSDAAATVPERTRRVGRHGRHRRRQTTNSSSADVLSRHVRANCAVTVEMANSDHSTSVNCLDNGFMETSPSSVIAANVEHIAPLLTDVQVILRFD